MPYRGDFNTNKFNPSEKQLQAEAVRKRNQEAHSAEHLGSFSNWTTKGQGFRRSRVRAAKRTHASVTHTAPTKMARPSASASSLRRASGRMQGFYIDPRSIDAFYEYAQDFKNNAEQFKWGMDKILMMYAYLALAGAQKRSLGPVDPTMQNMAAAWKVPVRRITGAYFLGWEVQHISLGVWALTNTSREAFFLEFGINHIMTGLTSSGGGARVRIRRPVMKLAVLEAINIARQSNAAAAELVKIVAPSGLYQSPFITGQIRRKGPSGSALGLVNLEQLAGMVGGAA